MVLDMMLQNQILFCFILGAVGGVIKLLDFNHSEEDADDKFELKPFNLLRRAVVSGVCGLAT